MNPFDIVIRTIFMCYTIDSEMFTGDQRFTEDFIQKYIDEVMKIAVQVKNDKSAFCFTACGKKRR